MLFSRKIYPHLVKHLKNRHITVLTGMRRTGKTTLVKLLLKELKTKNKLYIDLERIDNREIFLQKNYEAVVDSFKQQGINISQKAYIAIDEIQLAPSIPSVLKYLYDNYKIKFIVTGSSSYYLKNLFSESLSGRKKIFELYPLDFGEFLTFNKISYSKNSTIFSNRKFNSANFNRLKSYYEEFISYGGFPEVVLSQRIEDKKDLLGDILDSYIRIDIKNLADFRNSGNIYKLSKMLASRVGSKLDYSKLSRLSGISRPTVQNYIDFFEKTYFIHRVNVFSKNPDREIVKAQKLYFCDNGLLNILAEISGGAKFENAIFNQLRHYGKLQYYSLKNGREIDFILNNKIGLEIKETPIRGDKKSLKGLANFAKIQNSCLIGRNSSPKFDNYIWGGEIF